jgi:hypothetical protein
VRSIIILLIAFSLLALGVACARKAEERPPAPVATFEVSNLTITPAQAAPGDTVTISVDVRNTGNASGEHQVALKIDNLVFETKTVTLEPGETKTVSFSVVKDVPQTYSVAIEGLTGTFTLTLAAAMGTIEVRVTDPPPPGVTSAVVHLRNIEAHKVTGEEGEWIMISEDPATFDLLQVVGVEEVLAAVQTELGSFTQIRMDVTKVVVETAEGDTIEATVPSDKLKIVKPFTVEAGVTTVLTLDFDGDKCLMLAGGKAQFKPVVKLLIAESPNQSPHRPTNVSPPEGAADVSLTPTLQSSAFSDPDAGDIRAASQWQIREATGDYSRPVFDSGADSSNLTQITIPPNTLSPATGYFWRVRHQDNQGAWSAYSPETTFTTSQ